MGLGAFSVSLAGPGMEQLEEYTDVREIQRALKAAGVELTEPADENTSGPAHIAFLDRDGNPILIDQLFLAGRNTVRLRV